MKTLSFFTLLLVLLGCSQTEKKNTSVSETVSIQQDDFTIQGVLSTPSGEKNVPVVVFVAGSGPTDRDGNQPGMQTNCMKYLSEDLIDSGFATFRYDKRGVGKSLWPGFQESELTIDLYADDLKTIIDYLKDLGFPKVLVAGHSQGALLGLIAIRDAAVDGYISIAGAGYPANEAILRQLKPKVPEELYNKAKSTIQDLKNGSLVDNYPTELNALFRKSVQPFLMSWFQYNPAELIGKTDCPVLILQGTKDLQVQVDDARNLAKAQPNGKLVVVENMNHVMKTIEGGVNENMASYSNPELPINTELIETIVEFLKSIQ